MSVWYLGRRVSRNVALPLAALFLLAAANAQAPAKVAPGVYECLANGRPRLLLNFSIKNSTQYIGSDNTGGTYAYAPATGRISFNGGALDGVLPKGHYTVYHEPKGFPTVSFRNAEGYENAYCEKLR